MPMNNRKLVPQKLPLLLDYAPGAAAYSLRSLSNSYVGPVVTVRRSTDSAERGFTATEVSDGTLAAWCGGGDGYVKTWHDQSGNDRGAQQATTTAQPQIVDSGVLVTEGGKPALRFDGGNDVLDLSVGVVASLYTNFAVAAVSSVSNNPIIGTDSGQSIGLWSSNLWYENNGTGGYISVPFTQDTEQHIYSATKSGDTADDFSLHTDGAYIGAATGGSGFASATWKYIGGRKVSGAAYFAGTISELLIYPTDMTALRTRIEGDLAWYY